MNIKEYQDKFGHEQVVFCHDKKTNLRAIIAIHDTTLGPALGGCRFRDYKDDDEALFDVMRLSRGMTYKAAVAGLTLGGGKSVIIGDPAKLKTPELLRAFGRFVQNLNGRYITAEDLNMSVSDIEIVAEETDYVSGLSGKHGSGDPSPITALGCLSGIKASAEYKLGRKNLKGVKVAVQGCGKVGQSLCELLHAEGAELWVSDVNPKATKAMEKAFKAKIVDNNAIFSADVDIFAPCALGAIVNRDTIPMLKASIVAGSANNQLLDEEQDLKLLTKRGILYAPDFVINAGGLINVFHELKGYNESAAKKQALKIGSTLNSIYKTAEEEKISTLEAAYHIANKRIEAGQKKSSLRLNQRYDNQRWIKAS